MKTFIKWLQTENVNKTTLPSFQQFKSELQGWMVTPDGQSICPDCWQNYVNKAGIHGQQESMPSVELLNNRETRRLMQTPEGWFAQCDRYPVCQNVVSIDY